MTTRKPAYREEKAIEVAVRLLKLAGGQMKYLLLIKLMYLVERYALVDRGSPVFYDALYSLDYGPVVSYTKDRIDYGNGFFDWNTFIRTQNYYAKMVAEPTDSCLSEYEVEVLEQVFRQYGHWDAFRLCRHLHDTLPEWKDPSGSSTRIEYEDILKAENWDKSAIEQALGEIDYHQAVGEMFVA